MKTGESLDANENKYIQIKREDRKRNKILRRENYTKINGRKNKKSEQVKL